MPLRGIRGLTEAEVFSWSAMANCCSVKGVESGSKGSEGDSGEGRSDNSNSGEISDGKRL